MQIVFALVLGFSIAFASGAEPAKAEGLLDGLGFSGMIGPVENPDLPDNLYFDDGHFWSDICTQCGFVPGRYSATETDEGIVFTGTLESESRGRFDYRGVITPDGSIDVNIHWKRERWYWTFERDIAFVGAADPSGEEVSLNVILTHMASADTSGNPLCARF